MKPGRPKKAGDRYPSGQRKTAGPMKRPQTCEPSKAVLERRRAILGAEKDAPAKELRAAENPLDTMEARGWLEPSLARAGRALAELYRTAGHHARRVTASLEEAPETSGVDKRRITDMTPAEVAEIWRVLERRDQRFVMRAAEADDREPEAGTACAEATRKLKALWIGLGPRLSAELLKVCVLDSWPMWAMQGVAGRDVDDLPYKWLRPRLDLIEGLTIVREVLTPKKARQPSETVRDHPFLGPTVEELVEYVDDEGRPDPVTNRSGVVVEVVRRRRA